MPKANTQYPTLFMATGHGRRTIEASRWARGRTAPTGLKGFVGRVAVGRSEQATSQMDEKGCRSTFALSTSDRCVPFKGPRKELLFPICRYNISWRRFFDSGSDCVDLSGITVAALHPPRPSPWKRGSANSRSYPGEFPLPRQSLNCLPASSRGRRPCPTTPSTAQQTYHRRKFPLDMW